MLYEVQAIWRIPGGRDTKERERQRERVHVLVLTIRTIKLFDKGHMASKYWC